MASNLQRFPDFANESVEVKSHQFFSFHVLPCYVGMIGTNANNLIVLL